MYKSHQHLTLPENCNQKIWRYLDIAKFIALISNQTLYFSRADLLGDKFEGSLSQRNLELREEWYTDIPPEGMRTIVEVRKNTPYHTFINCWHMNDFESAAMWELYGLGQKGIAIQSSIKRLQDSFVDPDNDVYMSIINYIDYSKDIIPESNVMSPFCYKRKSYEHEKEIRAIILKYPPAVDGHVTVTNFNTTKGIDVKVNLIELVENIYIAPNSPDWYFDQISIILEKFGQSFNLHKSNLNDDPVY